ncbi:prolipoprotein diacylglyceryl transferase [Pendulispora brunnea]|uniref:Prolipoprotein diacylglyceryl transferase n=1 Tax=Pendulispora brunnea TaxID=2905690 RepID=A0ABZ2KGG7_9BACT
MRPVLVYWLTAHGIPSWLAPDYATMCGLATLFGAMIALRLAARDGESMHVQARALVLAYLAALLGGYVFEWGRAIPEAVAAGSFAPIAASGRAAYGGLLAGILAPALYLRFRNGGTSWMPARRFLDRATPGMGIAFAMVRIGCFLEGCDYGKPTSSPLGVRFPIGSIAAEDHAARGWIPPGAPSLPVHATELYESLVGLAASLFAWRFLSRRRDGGAFLAWIAAYASGRFAVELLRGDDDRGLYLGLSSAQFVSLVLLAGVFLLSRRWCIDVFHRPLRAAAVLLLVLLPRTAHAQGADAIVLDTGERLTGVITELSPGDHVAIRLANGQVTTISWIFIDKLERGGRTEWVKPVSNAPAATPSPTAIPTPTPTPSPTPMAERDTRSVQYARRITLQVSLAPSLTLARPDVPSGLTSELDVLYRLRLGGSTRLDLGLEGRVYANDLAYHYGLGVPFQFALEAGRHLEVRAIFVPTHTWLVWDTKVYANVNVWALRMGAELAWVVSSHVTLGLSPIGFNVISAESVGVITSYEPRLSFGLAF